MPDSEQVCEPAGMRPACELVGRQRELSALLDTLDGAWQGTDRLKMVSGATGIGKTRLVTEFAKQAHSVGFQIVWGYCAGLELPPTYWPWRQVLRSIGQPLDEATLGTDDLLRWYDAVAAAVRAEAAQNPVLIILEDLHEADRESLQLTQFLLQHWTDAPIVVVGTIRIDTAREAEFAGLIDSSSVIGLDGLSVAAVEALIPDPSAAPAVHAASGGNPLIIEQLLLGGHLHSAAPHAVGQIHQMTANARVLWHEGRYAEADAIYRAAWPRAEAVGNLTAMVDIALGPELRFDFDGLAAAERARWCEIVLARLPQVPSRLRAQVLTALVAAQFAQSVIAARESEERLRRLVEQLGDPIADGYALVAKGLLDAEAHAVDASLDEARQIVALAQDSEPRLWSVGYFLLLSLLLTNGDIRSLDRELARSRVTLARLSDCRPARVLSWFRGLRVILDGDTERAERLIEDSLVTAELSGDPDAHVVWSSQIGIIRWQQGRVDEAEAMFLMARQQNPDDAFWTASLAWLWLLQGRDSAAEDLLAGLYDVVALPRNRNWLATMTVLADIATRTGSETFARDVYGVLLPYADRIVPVGIGVGFLGTSARSLGLLAERLGDLGGARHHLLTSIDISRRSGTHAWTAEAQIELADFNGRHDEAAEESLGLLREALATSTALGFPLLQGRAEYSLRERAFDREANPPALHSVRPEIRVVNGFEVRSHSGIRAAWTSRKARMMLKLLIAARGVPVPREVLMEQLWPGIDRRLLSNRFSVAISTVRRALDPGRSLPHQQFVVVEDDAVRLRIERLSIDLETYFALLADPDPNRHRIALERFGIGVFADEPYADWALPIRHEVSSMFCEAALRLARLDLAAGDARLASDLCRKVVAIDPYNEPAGTILIEALTVMEAYAEARAVRAEMKLRSGDLQRGMA